MAMIRLSIIAIFAAAACGGQQSTEGGPGDTRAVSDDQVDLDPTAITEGDPGMMSDAGLSDAALPPAPVTFVLINESPNENLVLPMDRGWQPVITAYYGQPPKATPILMFPTHCTAACEAPETERCPYCPEPEKVKDIKAAEQRTVIAPGEMLEVPWDAKVHVYEKTRGKRESRTVRCDCYQVQDAPPETYTVRGFGLRLTSSAEETSRVAMATSEMVLPAEEPIRVELRFSPAPPAAGKKKK
jgi:hypothetical protein